MAKFDHTVVERWREQADTALAEFGLKREDVTNGIDAWAVARKAGIQAEAYSDRSVVDAHIVTALKAILPNVVFKDTYNY